jgi:hypothetical protein
MKQADKDMAKANLLAGINNLIWRTVGISSGSELDSNQSLQKKYLSQWRIELRKHHITSVGEKVCLILEDQNYHSANEALAIIGVSPPTWHPKTWNRFGNTQWKRLPSGWWVYT